MDRKKTLLLSFIILLAGAGITAIIFSTEPTATREGATKQTAMLVEIIDAEKGNFTPTVTALGTVEAAEDIILSPRVSGEIIQRSPDFTPGGFVNKGDELLKIDPSDYRNILHQRQSELQQAEADYQIELGRQSIARQDYEMLNDTLSEENRSLVLRQPQLNASRSRVESARAAVEQAQLDLALAQRAASRSALAETEARLENARRTLARQRDLMARDLTSQAEVDLAETEGVRVAVKSELGCLSEDPDTLMVLCDNVHGLGIALDPSVYICGPAKGKELDRIMKYVFNVHLRDSRPDAFHVSIGQGVVDYGRLINQLEREGYDRTLTIQVPPIEGLDHRVELRKLRRLLESLI